MARPANGNSDACSSGDSIRERIVRRAALEFTVSWLLADLISVCACVRACVCVCVCVCMSPLPGRPTLPVSGSEQVQVQSVYVLSVSPLCGYTRPVASCVATPADMSVACRFLRHVATCRQLTLSCRQQP